jgi:hypothetical protein
MTLKLLGDAEMV